MKKIATICLILLASSAVARAASATTRVFDTNFGVFTLTDHDGTYADSDGRVANLKVDGDSMDGTWTQTLSSHRCPDGSYRGSFHLQFTQDGFTGTWGWCDGPLTAGVWNGKRR